MAQKTRSELQGLFQTGAKPSQQDFADFIESTLNIKDDGIEKPSSANSPLKITAQGTDEKLLDFYAGDKNTWSINQKLGGNKIGLNISNSEGTKLFIDSGSGNVGLSIDQPTAKLHIQQTGNEDALRIDDELKDTTPFLINKDGNVGIGTINPGAKLEVVGGGGMSVDLIVNGRLRSNNNDGGLWIAADRFVGGFDTDKIGFWNNNAWRLTVQKDGNVGIGTPSPIASLDIASVTRIDAANHPKSVKGLYITGDFAPDSNGVEFRHTNGSQGIGFGYNTIYATGSNANQDLNLKPRGVGQVVISSGNLSIQQGNLTVNGTIYAGGNPIVYENYEIYLRGSARESLEGEITFLKVANTDMGMPSGRGLNTVILNPKGTFKNKVNHDVWGDSSLWNTWATWVNTNAAIDDIVAVASYDALNNAPLGGSAETLLRSINAGKALSAIPGRYPYTLLFIQGQSRCIEVLQPYKGNNVHLKTTYYQLLTLQYITQQEPWQTPTFQNGWVNYDTTYNPAGYFKDSLGIVHLRGLVKIPPVMKSSTPDMPPSIFPGGGWPPGMFPGNMPPLPVPVSVPVPITNDNNTIFILPPGYRPSNRELQAVQTNENAIGRLDVLTSGQVVVVSGNTGWLSLDGVTFRAA